MASNAGWGQPVPMSGWGKPVPMSGWGQPAARTQERMPTVTVAENTTSSSSDPTKTVTPVKNAATVESSQSATSIQPPTSSGWAQVATSVQPASGSTWAQVAASVQPASGSTWAQVAASVQPASGSNWNKGPTVQQPMSGSTWGAGVDYSDNKQNSWNDPGSSSGTWGSGDPSNYYNPPWNANQRWNSGLRPLPLNDNSVIVYPSSLVKVVLPIFSVTIDQNELLMPTAVYRSEVEPTNVPQTPEEKNVNLLKSFYGNYIISQREGRKLPQAVVAEYAQKLFMSTQGVKRSTLTRQLIEEVRARGLDNEQ